MTTIRNIVVATDFSPGSEAAVRRAVLLAQAHGASLRLLHAFDVSAWHSLQGVFDPRRFTTEPPPDVNIREQLSEQAASLAVQSGLQVEARFTVGDADSAINAYVGSHETGLVVLGSRADPGMAGLGSTASKVVRAPTCPVLVVRMRDPRPYDKVLCAVDMRESSIHAAAQMVAWFPLAHHHLLCALDPALQRALWTHTVAKEETWVQRESIHVFVQQQLEKLAQELTREAEHPVAAEVVDDVPAHALIARARGLPADCVAVGHHGQGTGVGRLLGNMAQHVLQHAARDVLVVP